MTEMLICLLVVVGLIVMLQKMFPGYCTCSDCQAPISPYTYHICPKTGRRKTCR